MNSDARKPDAKPAEAPQKSVPLTRVLGQSERVHDKVEQAAVELTAVNAVLKDEIADGVPLAKVERALVESEKVEVKVQEAAAELVEVNDALAQEIDERHQLEHRLSQTDAALSASLAQERSSRHSALHDPVTGLPNLTLFNDRLRKAISQAERHSWRLAVMFIDLDEFKSINDTHGHDAGDRVLQEVAHRLQTIVRSEDTVSRRSGDEFLFLMMEAGSDANAVALAAKILNSIADACHIDDAKLVVKASIGIALYPEDGTSAKELLRHADAAM
jgi:diguanylate cyclase (GGDEF)-like protein